MKLPRPGIPTSAATKNMGRMQDMGTDHAYRPSNAYHVYEHAHTPDHT